MNILILEKCKDVQYSLQNFIETLGHETMVVDTPISALSLSRIFNFDVLISEYFSDDLNYLKLFELIKSNKIHIKIIILTAMSYNHYLILTLKIYFKNQLILKLSIMPWKIYAQTQINHSI